MKVSGSKHTVDDATAVAAQWLAVSAQLIEGPEHAERITNMIDQIAHGHQDQAQI